MLYLLDANVLIDAKRDYYGMDTVPEFWDWLIYQGENNRIKIPVEIYDEFADAGNNDDRDELALWADQQNVKKALILEEDADMDLVARITYGGYDPDPTDDQLITIGRDPFLLSFALKDKDNRCVVSTEKSKPTATLHNRRIPDVCKDFEILFCDNFTMFKQLQFKTNWQTTI